MLVLRTVLFKLSIWDHNSSYGASLQNLKYADARSDMPVPSPPTRLQKALYGVSTLGGRYVWNKWEAWLMSQDSDDEEQVGHITSAMMLSTRVIGPFNTCIIYQTMTAPARTTSRIDNHLDRRQHVLRRRVSQFPIVPPKRPPPHPPRPLATHASRRAVATGNTGDIAGVSQQTTRLALLHGVSSLPTPPPRHQPLAPLARENMEESHGRALA